MRPVIELLRAEATRCAVTARDFAQTLQLLDRFAIEHTAIGRHRGERLADKAVGLASRSAALVRWARGARCSSPRARSGPTRHRRRFDIALGHGSNDVSVAARLLRIPCSTTFDYEWAAVQHHVNCRLAQAVVVPDAIPPERLDRYGAKGKVRAYEGLKEEYYLADFEPDRGGARGARARPRAPDRGRADPARGVAVPPLRERPLRRRARPPARGGARARACSRWCCRAPPPSARSCASVRGLHGARARDRRPVADRVRRSRDLRRRHDEPRGGGARHPRLHHVRGTPGRRRRAPDRRRPPAQAGRRRASCDAVPSASSLPPVRAVATTRVRRDPRCALVGAAALAHCRPDKP